MSRKLKRFNPDLLERKFDDGRELERDKGVPVDQRVFVWHKVAAACGVDPATLRNWRSGIGQPTADQYFALVHYLKIGVEDLVA